MFTGIIKELGEAVALRKKPSGAALSIKAGAVSESAGLGDSIAVNGVCLTVTRIDRGVLHFDLSDETLRATTLGALKAGEKVNLEPALRATDPLGGHLVTGHVDAVGRIRSRRQKGDNLHFEIEAPEEVLQYLVDKGSVAVDGISLTVVEALRNSFTIVIIPHTAKETTIRWKDAPSPVNLEADIIGKYVARFMKKGGGSLKKSLFDAGFITE